MKGQLISIRSACRGANEHGCRCRATVKGYGRCHQHQASPASPPPDRILLKVRVNDKRVKQLEAVGICRRQRDENKLDAKHAAQAEALGRRPDAIRTKPDSGVSVFPDGARMIDGRQLLPELRAAGFKVEDLHLYQKPNDHMIMLVAVLVKSQHPLAKAPSSEQVRAAADQFATTLEHTYVWANPTNNNGEIVHTINCAHRSDEPAQATLVYDNGQWALVGA